MIHDHEAEGLGNQKEREGKGNLEEEKKAIDIPEEQVSLGKARSRSLSPQLPGFSQIPMKSRGR